MRTYNHLKKEVKYTKIEEIIQLINGGRYDELKYRDDSILDNKDLFFYIMEKQPQVYVFRTNEVKNDMKIILHALKQDSIMFDFLKKDYSFLLKYGHTEKGVIKGLENEIGEIDKEEFSYSKYHEMFEEENSNYGNKKPKSRSLAQDNPEGDEIIDSINQPSDENHKLQLKNNLSKVLKNIKENTKPDFI